MNIRFLLHKEDSYVFVLFCFIFYLLVINEFLRILTELFYFLMFSKGQHLRITLQVLIFDQNHKFCSYLNTYFENKAFLN